MVKNNSLLKSLLMKVIKMVYMETILFFSHPATSLISCLLNGPVLGIP